MQILSIDPALNNVGYAILEKNNNIIKVITSGVIKSSSIKKKDPSQHFELNQFKFNLIEEDMDILKIKNIILHIQQFIQEYKISNVILEESFVNINMKSSLSLALSRGALIGFFSTFENIKIFQFTPTKIKKIITGNGNADKEQILKMLKILLPKYEKLQQIKKLDESDAIAIGLAFLLSC